MSGDTVEVSLGSAEVHDTPFRHVIFPEGALLPPGAAARLAATFPTTLRPTARADGGDKSYAVDALTLHDRGEDRGELARLGPSWRSLVRHLTRSSYRAELAALLGIAPGGIELELRLTAYRRAGWMSRHTDRPDKLFSHNIYFCPDWCPEWGGGLALYEARGAPRPASVFVPGLGNALAFARSDRSWHEVLPVSDPAPGPRRALLVHGYRSPATST